MDLRPPLVAALDAFAVAATVTTPGGPAVQTRVIWLPPVTVENPSGAGLRRAEAKRVLAVPSADVPVVPRGTVVHAPAVEGGPATDWRVDEAERVDSDHYRALVLPS